MQLSEKPTAHILVRASSDMYDSCDFAIITVSEQWKQDQLRRLEVARSLAEDMTFQSLNYDDHYESVFFLPSDKNGQPNIRKMLGNRSWTFVEVSPEELSEEELSEDELLNSNLVDYRLVIDHKGEIKYTANGQYTGDEFRTEEFPLQELLEQL